MSTLNDLRMALEKQAQSTVSVNPAPSFSSRFNDFVDGVPGDSAHEKFFPSNFSNAFSDFNLKRRNVSPVARRPLQELGLMADNAGVKFDRNDLSGSFENINKTFTPIAKQRQLRLDNPEVKDLSKVKGWDPAYQRGGVNYNPEAANAYFSFMRQQPLKDVNLSRLQDSLGDIKKDSDVDPKSVQAAFAPVLYPQVKEQSRGFKKMDPATGEVSWDPIGGLTDKRNMPWVIGGGLGLAGILAALLGGGSEPNVVNNYYNQSQALPQPQQQAALKPQPWVREL